MSMGSSEDSLFSTSSSIKKMTDDPSNQNNFSPSPCLFFFARLKVQRVKFGLIFILVKALPAAHKYISRSVYL